VANAAHGLALAGDRGVPGEVYHLSDGRPVELRAFLTRYLAASGVKAPQRTVTPRGARTLARAGELGWGMLGAKKAPPLTWAMFAVTGWECTVDDAKARRQLGYEPVVDHDRAMEELAQASAAKRRGRNTPLPG
jgi:nucleoside-diphosphate-sugar epimerase